MKHSLLPWQVKQFEASGAYYIRSADFGVVICDLNDIVEQPAKANTGYIVQACNTFPALVEALDDMIAEWFVGRIRTSVVERAMAALAAVKEAS